MIYTINLMLLVLGEHIDIVVSWYNLSLEAYVYIHK
jgi:hypothetical protein